jgi:hypothetical protein
LQLELFAAAAVNAGDDVTIAASAGAACGGGVFVGAATGSCLAAAAAASEASGIVKCGRSCLPHGDSRLLSPHLKTEGSTCQVINS